MGARAIVVQDGCLLVIRRFKAGRWHAVIPGGKVEPGETPTDAAVRELAEETSLTAAVDRLFWDNAADQQLFFLMGPATGTLALGGPEALEQSEDNQHVPTWVPLDQLDEIGLVPSALIDMVRACRSDWRRFWDMSRPQPHARWSSPTPNRADSDNPAGD